MKLAVHSALAAVAILCAVVAAHALTVKTMIADRDGEPPYEKLVPDEFGDWKLVPSIRLVTPVEPDALANRVYSQMIGRGYTDRAGNLVMLLVAYGPRQLDKTQLHRPEICYVAEGFEVSKSTPADIDLGEGGRMLHVRKMVARRENRTERITYWMRVGDDIVSTLLDRQVTKLRYGLRGFIPDGVLIRVSTINLDARTADQVQTKFLRDLMRTVPDNQLRSFVGNEAVRGATAAPEPKTAAAAAKG